MSTYFSDAAEFARRAHLDQIRHHTASPRRPRARTRVAVTLRRAAERLEQ